MLIRIQCGSFTLFSTARKLSSLAKQVLKVSVFTKNQLDLQSPDIVYWQLENRLQYLSCLYSGKEESWKIVKSVIKSDVPARSDNSFS